MNKFISIPLLLALLALGGCAWFSVGIG